MKKKIPQVSIIIPIYNVERYIIKCLDSIIKQTLKEIEILCIDDGSIDASREIIDEYANKDCRFKVVHQENKGAAAARNVGLDMAMGEWIAFMDPDDYYPDKNTLLVMYDNAVRHGVQVCGGSVWCLKSRGWRLEKKSRNFSEYQFSQDGVITFKDYQFDYGFWRFLYKRELIEKHHIRFPFIQNFEDPPFMTQVFSIAGSFYALRRPTYIYREGNGWVKIDWTANNYIKARHMLKGMELVCKMAEKENLEKLRLRRLRNLFYGAGEVFQREVVLSGIKEEYAQVLKQYTPMVTIVVPVYNDEKYIGECLDSILSQSYKNIEIICVNDGSTDATLSILERYSANSDVFFRFIIISQENAGLSAARNAGIKRATGKYIYFLDSDDMLNYKNAILDMVLLAEEYQLDQLIFACRLFTDEKNTELVHRMKAEKKYHTIYKPLEGVILPGIKVFSLLEKENHFFATQQTRFYLLRSLTDYNLTYPDGLLHEDNYMAPVSLRFAKKAMLVNRLFLARRIRTGSIVTSTSDKSARFKGLWGIVELLCQDKRLWDAPEDFCEMLRKYIHERLSDMYWLVEESHDEELFAKKMLVRSCVMNRNYDKRNKIKKYFQERIKNLFSLHIIK